MRTLFVSLFLLASSGAQSTITPGTITQVRTALLTATAGNVNCTVTTSDAGVHIQLYCYINTALVMNLTLATMPDTNKDSGAVASYSYKGDGVTAMCWRPTAADPVNWQITANGTYKEGVF